MTVSLRGQRHAAAQVSPWEACSLGCGGGIQTRTVTCMDQLAQAANDSACLGVRPADELQCNVLPCDFCATTDCAQQV